MKARKAKENRQTIPWKSFFTLLRKIRVPWALYLAIFLLSVIISRTTVELPMMMGETINAISMGAFDSTMILRYIGLTLAVTVSYNLTSALSIYANNLTTKRARLYSWNRILRIPLAVHKDEDELDLISRVTHDPTFISGVLDRTIRLVIMTYTFVLTLKMIWQISPRFGQSLLWTFPYLILVGILTGGLLERAQRRVQKMQAEMIGFFAEHYGKLKLIKVFSREQQADEATDAYTDRHFKSRVKRWLVDALAVPLRSSTQALLTGLTLIYGGILIQQGQLEAAMLVSLHSYTTGLNNYFVAYVNFYQSLKSVKGGVTKISTIFEAKKENFAGLAPETALETADSLALEAVDFAYKEDQRVLEDFTARIKRGAAIALLGPSGSGKSTLFKLILRLFQPQHGRFLLDETDVNAYALGTWRAQIGYASQDPVVFHGSLRENLAYGADRHYSDEELTEAAAKAGLDLEADFPAGLETECGEYGSLLSGGQRQRVAIARLFLQDPKILLLDEVSSALDTETAEEIKASLESLKRGRTSIEIAHKLHELDEVDTIWLLDKGKLVAEGTHAELLSESGLYRSLVEAEETKLKALRAKQAG